MDEILDNIITHCYSENDVEHFILTGDLNAHTGELLDYTVCIDNLADRLNVDKKINQHGKSLIDILICNKWCIINGRKGVQSNQFTCQHAGNSVVDYFITNHENLANCKNMTIHTIDYYVDNLKDMINITDTIKLSDHMIMLCEFDLNFHNAEKVEFEIKTESRIHDLKNFPETFMNIEAWKRITKSLIEDLCSKISSQVE